jgi:hypothetical protein
MGFWISSNISITLLGSNLNSRIHLFSREKNLEMRVLVQPRILHDSAACGSPPLGSTPLLLLAPHTQMGTDPVISVFGRECFLLP